MALLTSVMVLAIAAPSFSSRANRAERVANIGRFLEKYVGDCESDDAMFDADACERTAKSARKDYRGRTLRFEVSEPSGQLKVAKFDRRRNAYQVLFTPFFSERALGLSVGRPRLNKKGFPVVKNIPIWVKPAPDVPDFVFRRQLERGMVRLELLVRPVGAYRLAKRGEVVRGADVRLVGLRMLARDGTVLAEQTY